MKTVSSRAKNLVLFYVLLVSIATLLGGCGLCNNDEQFRVASPDSALEAVIFQRDCGATTGFSTQISIVTKGSKLPNGGGNLFLADTDHGKAPAASWGGPEVAVDWVSKRTVRVVTPRGARVFHKEPAISISTGILSRENVTAEYAIKSP
jgi:hypothetical protein